MKEGIESVYRWCCIAIDFFLNKESDFVFMKSLKKTVFLLKLKNNMKGLKGIKKEIETEFVSELSEKDRAELSVLLNDELLDSDIHREVRSIIDRGYIVSDDEYILLTNYTADVNADIEPVNDLLIEYYNKKD